MRADGFLQALWELEAGRASHNSRRVDRVTLSRRSAEIFWGDVGRVSFN